MVVDQHVSSNAEYISAIVERWIEAVSRPFRKGLDKDFLKKVRLLIGIRYSGDLNLATVDVKTSLQDVLDSAHLCPIHLLEGRSVTASELIPKLC
jgi:hypothetical protein